jgi:prepilin-type N-terminal cleavage/methylation domain-containing protein
MRCGISRTQYNACCCCNEKGRDHLKAASGGFTLIEIVIVVVIVAIAAMTAIPIMTSATSFQIRSAANVIAADLEYAKTIAISKGQSFSVVFDKTTESYRIEDQTGAVIAHPVKKGFHYVVDFRSDGRLNKVDIEDVNFDATSEITFDYLGSPYSGSGISNPLNSGVITLKAGNMAATINIEPVTGFISIVD